jgi:3-phosphoglycerate kinase
VKQSKFILWNGPLGNYEEGFSEGTKKLAEIISKANAKSVVGGGDTVAAIQSLGLLDKFSFVSTGGGAMLDFLANETLPGIQAMEDVKISTVLE